MENIEENVVTKGAAAAEAMPSSGASVEDLGGPTPENYRPDDDSAKLKDPAATLAQVKDVVNAKAAKAEAVSPPAVEKAKGKLLAAKTTTGPIGINIRLTSGFGTGSLSGIALSIVASRHDPSSIKLANI